MAGRIRGRKEHVLAKAKRVFELAKELGVKSKAIVEKCQAEGVPDITNHMSTVKVGLAVTIHQWFSEDHSEGDTAIETAEKVDLKKARKKATKKAAKKATAKDDDADQGDAATATATLEAPAKAKKAAKAKPKAKPKPAEKESEQAASADQAVVEQAPETEAETQSEAAAAEQAPAADAPAQAPPIAAQAAEPETPDEPDKPVGPVGKPNVPTRPDVVKPAGEQLEKPQQVQLKGPKVLRIEKPDPQRPPRPRKPQGPGGRSDRDMMDDGVPGISRTRGPARGRGAGGGGAAGGDQPRQKRRGMNTRRGRGDVLPTGPTKFSQADMDELDARLSGATGYLKQRRRNLRKTEHAGQAAQSAVVTGGKVEIQEPITIKALSAATGIKGADIVKWLFKQGMMATINSAIETEAAMEVALEYDIELEVKEQQTAEEAVEQEFAQRDSVDERSRPPVVTVLGHVDHGKTSLLDKIRKADVATHEAGGITQHVGAYRVTVKGSDNKDKTVVFLDTPGHEAFTSMRARGAGMTDLVVLVCAADDGVMPQTIESISHAKAAGVPLIVALNKIDIPQATDENIQKIYGQLAEHGLNPVEWGGDTEVIKTSAETGQGIPDLLEVLDYQAELLELKADYGGPARGAVIETEMQPGRGSVARVLVQDGQIKVGDFIVIGRAFGRVRDMTNDREQSIKQAGPATPLELSGIDEIPDAGDKFYVTQTLQKAENVAKQYRENERKKMLAAQTKVTLDNFAATIKAGQANQLRVVLKADVQGSMDVLRNSLEKLGNEEVNVKVIHSAVGGVTENDVLLADASDAIVIGFHVAATSTVKEIAEARGVDIRLYRVIYDITDDVTKALEGMLAPETKEEVLGQAEVKQVFKIGKVGMIAGCIVTEGTFQKAGKARLERDGVVVTDNREVESLKRVKDDAREVRAGTECGIRLKGFEDIKPDDVIVCYNVKEVARKLE